MTVRSVALAFAMLLTVATAMAAALTFTAVSTARAQSDVPGPGMEDGIVAKVDSAAGVVTLQDGRMYRVKPGTEFVHKGSPLPVDALVPGDYITITGAEPVDSRDGQHVPTPGR